MATSWALVKMQEKRVTEAQLQKSKQQIWLFCASKDCTINMQMIQTFLVYGGITLSLELTLKEFQEVEEEEGLEDT